MSQKYDKYSTVCRKMRKLDMKVWFSLAFIGSLFLLGNLVAVAQEPPQAQPQVREREAPQVVGRDYTALLEGLFAPITEQLKLTKEQEFRIIAIIIESEVKSDSAMRRFDDLERLLAEHALGNPLDEPKIQALVEEEAELLSQMINTRVHAYATIYQVLTPEQRALVMRKLLGRNKIDADLGAISIY
jgi:Spy/CpxP family protein refolding chaperone